MSNCKINRNSVLAFRYFLLLLLAMGGSYSAHATVFNGTLVPTVTLRSCYNGSMSVSYVATIPPPSGYTYGTNYTILTSGTSFSLRDAFASGSSTPINVNSGGTVNASNQTISGSFTISTPGVYSIYSYVVIRDILGAPEDDPIANIPIVTFTVGYNSMWTNMIDMTVSGTTVSRNTLTSGITFGGAKSSNYLAASTNGWIDLGAQFQASSTTRSIYIMLTDFGLTTAFNPSGVGSYIEYRKGGTITSTSGEGIYFKSGSSICKLQGVVLSDRLRLEKNSNTLRIYKSNSTTQLTWTLVSGTTVSTIPLSNELFAMAYAPMTSDGIASVITSFGCGSFNTNYAKLERNLTGVNYPASDKLYFSYDEEYAPSASTTLNYRILNNQHKPLQTGATVPVNRAYGDNRYELTLGSSINTGTYILEVTNEKKEVFYLRFTKQ
jgi:hypothetical protein